MNNLKRAIDNDLSRLRVTEQGRAAILENAMEGKKVKKKLSVALVLTMVLLLAAAVALAYTLISNQYFEDVAALESEHGFYEDWSLKEKLSMVRLMKDYGVDVDKNELDALLTGDMSDREREQRIDALMIDRYGVFGRMDVITLESVLQKELGGGIETWTQEQKAWYSQMLIDSGLMGGDDDLFRMPAEDVISADEAVAIAKNEVMRALSLTEEDLKGYDIEWEYKTHISDKEEKWLHYEVYFRPTDKSVRQYDCYVYGDGRLLTSADGELFSSVEEQTESYRELDNQVDWEARELFQQYATEHGFNKPVGQASIGFWDWPLADKKAIADIVRPVVLKNMAANPNYADWTFVYYAKHVFGVPDENAMTQEDAQTIAREALASRLGVSGKLLGYCELFSVYYDVTDPAAPLWKLNHTAGRHWDEVEAMGVEPRNVYRIVINAYTKEIVEAYAYHNGDDVTGLEAVERSY